MAEPDTPLVAGKTLRAMDWMVVLGLSLSFAVVFWLGTKAYANLQFSSDGFHYYSFLRNLSSGHGPWEGPVFEYLLGNHGYFTLLFFAIPVALFRSPEVLLFATLASHWIAAALLFVILRKKHLLGHLPHRSQIVLLPLLFLASPVIFGQLYGGHHLFQPDYLAEPLLLGIYYGMAFGRRRVMVVGLLLLLLTKEEFFVTGLLFVLLLAVAIPGTLQRASADYRILLVLAGVVAGAALLVFGTMDFFQQQNTVNWAVRKTLYFGTVLDLAMFPAAMKSVAFWIAPVAPFFVWKILADRTGALRSCLLFALLILFLSLVAAKNILVYGGPLAIYWSIVTVPVACLAVTTELICSGSERQQGLFRWRLLHSLAATTALLGCLIVDLWGPARTTVQQFQAAFEHRRLPEELRRLQPYADALLVPSENQYFITEEYLMAPFMEYSHVTLDWLSGLEASKRQSILAHSTFLLLRKETWERQAAVLSPHAVVVEVGTEIVLARTVH